MSPQYPDCRGNALRKGNTVYSTQRYQFGAVIQGKVVRLLEKRPGIIEVRHQDGDEAGKTWEMTSRLWSLEPTEEGPLPFKREVTCICCAGKGKRMETVLPELPDYDS